LPLALQDAGGWENRCIVDAFVEFTDLVAGRFGDRVSMWTTINEPWVMTYLGYAFGAHAPGKSDWRAAAAVHHHVLLAHAASTARFRQLLPQAQVGIALNMSHIYPAVSSTASVRAADVAFDQLVNSFLDPIMTGRYPGNLEHFSAWWQVGAGIVEEGDLARIATPLDFLTINEYHPRYVVDAADLDDARLLGYAGEPGSPFAIGQPFVDVDPPSRSKTLMGWIVEPNGLRDLLVTMAKKFPGLPLYISENGAAYADYLDQNSRVVDTERTDYLDGHLRAAHEAIGSGVDLRGYFLWSFLDNFEWAEGYSKRFGIVYVHYPTGDRTPKASFDWYRSVIAENAVS
jgi:beta-glucosidase